MRDRTSLYYLEKQPQIDELKLHRLLIRPVIWLRQRRRPLHDSRIFDQLTGLMVTADEKRIYEPVTKESTSRYRRAAASNQKLVVYSRDQPRTVS
jgi:hypothetical protein